MAGELTRAGVIKIDDDFAGYSLESFLVPQHYSEDLEHVLIPHGLLCDRVERMALDILSSYPPGEPVICVCILKSAVGFFTALTGALQRVNLLCHPGGRSSSEMYSLTSWDENGIDQAHHNATRPLFFEFIRVQSYMDDHSSGSVEIQGIMNMKASIQGKNTLIVEDMIDTGATMQKVLEQFEAFDPKSLKVATLLRKRCPHGTGYMPDCKQG
ncbi:hypoxanthine-guanine phosphoribosyltransferase-like isoform X2 [Paramacrobiotus metropolitanus]|uniref:hypoxanthine-guanine phosphoribosyltransferase-like isoform X2 n=1 Tax=Paramacrobiotus metropolitanus TaxID=2943436 RepID=UPI00244626A4|nr:hypoxanthine-guanine phosphoribosyltransferase-like isoform X2 [Paramacrobiotus metropolitanus]